MAKIQHYPIIHIKENIEIPSINDNNKVTIITTFTDRDKAILINQLEDNNIDYVNASEKIDNFIKAYKPIYYYNVLKNIKTEYVLIIDSYDSIINSLDNIEGILENYNKNILYSSWNVHFPTYFDVDFSVPDENNQKYLNSGVLFGKTKDVKAFYKSLSEYIENEYSESNHWLKNYEQYWIYKFLSENTEYIENVGIDYDELIATNKKDYDE